jgi:hypothetical protein
MDRFTAVARRRPSRWLGGHPHSINDPLTMPRQNALSDRLGSRASVEQHRLPDDTVRPRRRSRIKPTTGKLGRALLVLGFRRLALRCTMACPPEGHPPARSRFPPSLGTGRWASDAEQPHFWPHGLPAAPGVAQPACKPGPPHGITNELSA